MSVRHHRRAVAPLALLQPRRGARRRHHRTGEGIGGWCHAPAGRAPDVRHERVDLRVACGDVPSGTAGVLRRHTALRDAARALARHRQRTRFRDRRDAGGAGGARAQRRQFATVFAGWAGRGRDRRRWNPRPTFRAPGSPMRAPAWRCSISMAAAERSAAEAAQSGRACRLGIDITDRRRVRDALDRIERRARTDRYPAQQRGDQGPGSRRVLCRGRGLCAGDLARGDGGQPGCHVHHGSGNRTAHEAARARLDHPDRVDLWHHGPRSQDLRRVELSRVARSAILRSIRPRRLA